MNKREILRLGSVRDAGHFQQHLIASGLEIPCDRELLAGADSPLSKPMASNGVTIGNRIAIQPMEGWDGAPDGNPTESTLRRWRRFGQSGAKLIWGGEAVAVSPNGRANPNQLLLLDTTKASIAALRTALVEEHKLRFGTTDDLLIGLQLTHSGRFSRPNQKTKIEP